MTTGFHPPVEEYLEAMFELEEAGVAVIRARLAERLGHAAPTVSEMVRRLEGDGYVQTKGRTLKMTTSGRNVAESVVRKHRLAERLLADVIGLEWHKVHAEAGRWEHVISDDVEERLVILLENPSTCPHGNPIPGASSIPAPKTMPLNEAVDGQDVELDYITEGGERDVRLLGYLQEHGLRPGAKVHVLEVAPSLGMMTLKVGGDEFSLGIEAAKKIRVH